MRWDQINGDRWTIPETKNGKSHVVTLHPLALSILKKQRIISEGAFVFESTSNRGFPITGDAVTRALERLRKNIWQSWSHFLPMIYAAVSLLVALNIWMPGAPD